LLSRAEAGPAGLLGAGFALDLLSMAPFYG